MALCNHCIVMSNELCALVAVVVVVVVVVVITQIGVDTV